MKIAAHISGGNNSDGLLLALLKIIAVKYPQQHFTFFVEKRINGLPANCTQVIVSPKLKNRFLLYFWYTFKLPALLKKQQSDVFISDAGTQCQNYSGYQFLFICDLPFQEKDSSFHRKLFAAALVNAKAIFVTEDFIKERLVHRYKADASKIVTIYGGMNTCGTAFASNTFLEINNEQFTDGHTYFLYPVSTESSAYVITVLKAFSQLKKWQKTGMKLVFLLEGVSENNLIADFKNYKYKDDIRFVQATPDNKAALVQSAFSLIYFADYRPNNMAFEAFRYQVPVIAADNIINKSLFGLGAIFTSIGEKALSEKMQLLYKDELLKAQVIKQANMLLKKYDTAIAAEDLYKAMAE